MTLTEALAIVHPWLKTWRANQQCEAINAIVDDHVFGRIRCAQCSWSVPNWSPYQSTHDIPMPPATDELAMQVLRKAFREFTARGDLMMAHDILSALSEIPADPRDAIILAAASWLQASQKESLR